MSTPGAASSAIWTPSFVARSRTITTPRSSASRSEKGATSSSICPASTLDRSRTSLISASRWLPELRMSSRYSSCFSFTSPNIRSRSTCEKPMIAFSGVRSSCDMFARNSDLCRLTASSSRLFWSSSRECRRELAGPLVDLLLEPRIRLPEPRCHAIELLGERAQLVIARNLDLLVERTGADPRRRSLDRLDRPDEPAGEQDARWRSPGAGTRRAAAPCARCADFSGANASLSGSSTKTRQPSDSIVWKALSTFVPS